MKVTLDDIEPGDTVVAVLGAVGSGKSAFISAATGSDVGGVPKDGYGEGQVSKCLVSGTSIVFLEVPSSDEMGKFLVFVSEWLERASEMNLKIAGIIYIHSINSINHTLDSLPFFGSLNAGYPANFQSIILVTSMWGTGAKDDSQRERQLITEYWKPLLDRGSTAVRFLNTSPSALDILSNILPRKRGGTPASSIDPRSSRRIDAHPENGQYPHVSLLAALLDASSCFAFAGSGVDAWKDAVHATLAIMNTPEISQGHRRLFRYIASHAAELLFAISEQIKAGLPYVEVADTVHYLKQQLTRLLPLTNGALPVKARRWSRSPHLDLLKDCKLHVEAIRQFFEETTLLGLQGVIDRIEARLAGRSSNEYEPSLTESQFSSLESFTSEYIVLNRDGARRMSDLQHADRFLEVKYMAQTKGILERLEALVISARLCIPIDLGPQTEGNTPFKPTVLQAHSVQLHGLDRIAHLQQSINHVGSFVEVGLANCATVREPRPPKDAVSVAPIIVEPFPSKLRSEKPPYPKLVFDARLLSHSPKNSPATPTHRKSNISHVDKGFTRASPVMQADCTTYSPSLATSFLKEDWSPLIQRHFKPSFSSLAPFIPEDSFMATPTHWSPNLSPVDESLINTSNASLTSYTSHSQSTSITTHNHSDRLDDPYLFPSLGTPASTSAPYPVDGNTNQANRRTTSGGGSSSFSSLFGLYVDQLVETKEHVWFSSREAALVSINVNSLLIVEGDHFHGAINGSNSVGGLGNVYHGGGDVFNGSIHGCNVGGRRNSNIVTNDLNEAVRLVADYKRRAA